MTSIFRVNFILEHLTLKILNFCLNSWTIIVPFRKKEKKIEGHRVIFIFQEDQIYPPPPSTDFQDKSIKIVLKECFILSFIHHILRV